MSKLIEIAPPVFDVDLSIAYATADNITGRPIYARPACYLVSEAAEKLQNAVMLAASLGLRIRVFDGFRPTEAAWALWNHNPDPEFLADPRRGSPHSRGIAVDVTLLDAKTGAALDMGTPFDSFLPQSHHGRTDIPRDAQKNRALLLGLMTAAGWDCYLKEWWHYQLFNPRRFPLMSDAMAGTRMMAPLPNV